MNYMKGATNLRRAIAELDKYVISAVHGYAAGAGFSIALASDFIIADQSAKFAISFKNIGLIPDLGLIKSLTENLPQQLVKNGFHPVQLFRLKKRIKKDLSIASQQKTCYKKQPILLNLSSMVHH